MSDDPFVAHRSLLFTVAYEMLGSTADAEDVVQETWLRWADVDQAEVRDPRAYLLRIVTRQALDRLRMLARRREDYVGEWLPEPLLTSPDVAEDVELAENVSIAMLTVLDTRRGARGRRRWRGPGGHSPVVRCENGGAAAVPLRRSRTGRACRDHVAQRRARAPDRPRRRVRQRGQPDRRGGSDHPHLRDPQPTQAGRARQGRLPHSIAGRILHRVAPTKIGPNETDSRAVTVGSARTEPRARHGLPIGVPLAVRHSATACLAAGMYRHG
jgi:Sigma-70 region 2